MFDSRNAGPRGTETVVDFIIISLSLYVSCLFLSFEFGSGLFLRILAYSIILWVFVSMFKRALASHCESIGDLTCQIIGNAIGILTAACIMLLFEKFSSNQEDIILAIILSSALAFFVLSSIGSLVRETLSGRKTSAH